MLYNILDVYATAYFNNILIYLNNIKDYEWYVNNILDRLVKASLSINIDKYKFYTIRIKYFGLIITPDNIEIDPAKVKIILE